MGYPWTDGDVLTADDLNDATELNLYGAKRLFPIWWEMETDGLTYVTGTDFYQGQATRFMTTEFIEVYNHATYPNTGTHSFNDKKVWSMILYDDMQDNSIDATKWTTSNGTQDSSYITETAGAVTTDGYIQLYTNWGGGGSAANCWARAYASGKNFKGANGMCWFREYYSIAETVNAAYGVRIRITDGTSVVHLYAYYTAGTGTNDYRIDFNNTAGTCTLYRDGSAIASNVDISALTAWYVDFMVINGATSNKTIEARIYYFGYSVGSDTSTYISKSITDSGTIRACILTVGTTLYNGASAVYSVSANGGTNWETVTLDTPHKFTITGNSLRVKVAVANPALTLGTDKKSSINKIGVAYVVI